MKNLFLVLLVTVTSLQTKAQVPTAVMDYTVKLDEVAVLKTDKKELQISDSKKRFFLPEPQTTSWMLGRKFESKGDFKQLKKVIFYTKSAVDKGVCKVRVFAMGSDGFPAESLLPEDVIIEVRKGKQKVAIDLSKYNIQLPENGIVVAFESLVLEQNKYFQKATNPKTKERIAILNYAPHITYFHNPEKECYVYRNGKWTYNAENVILNHPIPAIDIIITD